jgi:hypothetical protein
MIAILMLVIFDNKLHWFQIKDIMMVMINGTLLMMKINFHPTTSFVLLWFISYPFCKRIEKLYADQI